MPEYAPKTLLDTYARIKLSSKVLSGVKGDSKHTYGYHRSRNALLAAGRTSDYSVVLQADKGGDGDACCGLDVSLNGPDMITASKRLMNACRQNDPRLTCWREWFGTMDGQRVTGWDRHDPATFSDDTPTTADSSHLWHIHGSAYRSTVNTAAVLGFADVINGVSLASAHILRRPWPAYMPAGHYFGHINGPAQSHGGYFASERPDVMAIQARLRMFKQPVTVDGRYGDQTVAAVTWWQKAKVPSTHVTKLGKLDAVAWIRLFTY